MQEARVQSLGGEDPLEKETATHSSIPAWEIPWTEEPRGLQSMGSQRIRHDGVTKHKLVNLWRAGTEHGRSMALPYTLPSAYLPSAVPEVYSFIIHWRSSK